MVKHPYRVLERTGFTLIELLVTISIIAVLMSLILPAIQNAREASRRTQCMNNIRNVTVAALGFAAAHKEHLPPAGNYVNHDDFFDPYAPTNPSWDIAGYNWVVHLLPYLDQQGIYDRWDRSVEYAANPFPSETRIAALICPNDDSNSLGGLSYVANGGFGDMRLKNLGPGSMHSFVAEEADWDGDGVLNSAGGFSSAGQPTNQTADFEDRAVTRATGVFWLQFDIWQKETRNPSARLDAIYDGLTNTLMFGENVNAGELGWGHPSVANCLFIFPYEEPSPSGCTVPDNTNFSDAPDYILRENVACDRVPAYPNEARSGPGPAPMHNDIGGAPYLNSNHPGIVAVSFCDGAVTALNESIDKRIYTHLMTPDGSRQRTIPGGFAAEDPMSDF